MFSINHLISPISLSQNNSRNIQEGDIKYYNEFFKRQAFIRGCGCNRKNNNLTSNACDHKCKANYHEKSKLLFLIYSIYMSSIGYAVSMNF